MFTLSQISAWNISPFIEKKPPSQRRARIEKTLLAAGSAYSWQLVLPRVGKHRLEVDRCFSVSRSTAGIGLCHVRRIVRAYVRVETLYAHARVTGSTCAYTNTHTRAHVYAHAPRVHSGFTTRVVRRFLN